DGRAAESRASATLLVLIEEVAHLIDGADAVQITLLLRLPPREQPVAPEDQAVAARVRVDGFPQHQRELEAWALPRDPDDLPSELTVELLELFRAVGARG